MSEMLNSRVDALREFSVTARRLNYRAAAGELGLDVTVLSRRIARLEARLGVRLLHRTTRRVTLTEAGSIFLPRCEELLSRLAEAEAEISYHTTKPVGTLRIAVPNMFGQRHIAPILPEFQAEFPELNVDITFSDHMIDLVSKGLDAAVRIGAFRVGGDLIARRLAPNRRLICASPAYLDAFGCPAVPSDLADHRILHFSPLLDGETWRLHGPDGEVEVGFAPVLRADNIEMIRQAALAGQGLALLATFVAAEDLATGHLVPVLPEWRSPDSDISVIYPNAPFVPAKVRAFVDFLVRKFAGDASWDRSVARSRGNIDLPGLQPGGR